MTERSVVYRLSADISQFKAQMAQASASVKTAADRMTGATAEGAKFRAGLTSVGDTAGKVGLVAAAGLGAAIKSSMDWESAWAGVTKTVDGSAAQMANLEEQLREMARTMPATHQEIAAVAEAAGQLGVATEDVASFTATMIQLAETTNLTADEAATSIAQLANIMGTAGDDIDNLGAALVAVGNAGASTEAQIIQMSQGIAGAANVVGLSEAEVLGIANAVASLGIEVEAGGTAISTVLTDMAKAVSQGGEDLDTFAQAAGVSAEEFARSFEERPAEAFTTFIEGLGSINDAGGDVFTMLDDLGLSDVRVSRALLGMAADSEKFAGSLDLSAAAWDENSALASEYAKRLDTTAAQSQIAWNNIKDAAIDVGDSMLPVVEDVAQSVAGLARAFQDLPEPVKNATGPLLGLTALFGGGLWFTAKTVSGVADMRQALHDMGITADSTKKAAKGVADAVQQAGRSAGKAFEEMSLAQVGLRSGAGIVGGLALAYNDLDQSTDSATRTIGEFTNIAGGALLGFAVGGPIGAAIGGGVAAISALTGAIRDGDDTARAAAAGADFYAASLDGVADAADEAARKQVALRLEEQGVLEDLQSLGIDTDTYVSAVLGQADAVDTITDRLATLRDEYTGLAAVTTSGDLLGGSFDLGGKTLLEQAQAADEAREANAGLLPVLENVASAFGIESRAVEDYNSSQGRVAGAAGETAAAIGGMEPEIRRTGSAFDEAADKAWSLSDAMKALNGLLDKRQAFRNYEAALDDFRDAMKRNGNTMDRTTEKGRENQERLDGIAESAGVVASQLKGVARTEFVSNSIAQLKAMAREFDIPLSQVRALIEKLKETGRQKPKPRVEVEGIPAAEAALNDLARDRYATIWVRHKGAGGQSAPGNDPKLATGGPVYGPGTATSDSIPAYLSNGEYVIRAAAVEKYGRGMFDHLNAMRFASGGYASRTAAPVGAPVAAPSLAGLEIVGTLRTPFGPAEVRGVVRSELAERDRDGFANRRI